MHDPTRRDILAASAVALFAQQAGQAETSARFYEKGSVRIVIRKPVPASLCCCIPGGGLNSTMSGLINASPFNPIEEFKGEYHCITSDLRNANGGQSSGPLEIDRPWIPLPMTSWV